jgi:23S rRNA (adenine2503-C2)-methyltransferase
MRISKQHGMPPLTNVVFMGMGDAGRNIAAVDEAVVCMTDKLRFSLPQNRITVSTVGPSPEVFKELARLPCNLAWSLHSPDDRIRKLLVPSTQHTTAALRLGLEEAMLSRQSLGARSLMVTFTLIDGINDSVEDADKVIEFMRPLQVVSTKLALDLIPYNDIHIPEFKRPSDDKVRAFQGRLRAAGYFCMVRLTRGDSESAACGMLATRHAKSRPAQ